MINLTPPIIYSVKYKDLINTSYCQIEAFSRQEAIKLFHEHYPYCRILMMRTFGEIAEDISDNLINLIKKQFDENNTYNK